ncbi:MAG: hypothetical protein JNM88_21630 [Chitinophagaceae bacterium]|nr:hypothetical protein [Chitinophagaceae bacterium]
MEQQPDQQHEHIVSDIYDGYSDTQKEVLAIETKKTSNKLFIIAGVLLAFNLLAVVVAGIPLSLVLFEVLTIPFVFIGLGFLALKEPLVAIILGMLVLFGLWIYNAAAVDASTLLQGWFGKAIVIYLLFAGLQNAREAHRIRRELKTK